MLSALQVEELKADLADVKEMYREQIDMLVNQVAIVIIIQWVNTNIIVTCWVFTRIPPGFQNLQDTPI